MVLHALAFAGRAAAAAGVEREAARRCSRACAPRCVSANSLRIVVPEADVGGRAGARRLADRRLVDFEHAVDLLPAVDARGSRASCGVLRRALLGRPLRAGWRTARRARACDLPEPDTPVTTTSRPSGTRTSTLRRLCSVAPSSVERRRASRRPARRGCSGCCSGLREEAAGDRLRRCACSSLAVPCGDDVAAALARAGAEVDDVVGAADRVLVVLDHDQRVALVAELLQRVEQDAGCRAGAGRWSARRARSTRPAGSSRAAPRAGCAAPRRPTASAPRGRAPGSPGRPRSRKREPRRRSRRARSRAISASRPFSVELVEERCAVVDRQRRELGDRAARGSARASATGFSRWPSQAAQASPRPRTTRSTRSPRRVCSRRRSRRSARPVPKQASHQPCLELNENSRGSSSGKLRPQDGQARLVENTWHPRADLRAAASTARARAPRPCRCRARAMSAARSSAFAVAADTMDRADRQLDRVLLEAVEPRPRVGRQQLAVDAQVRVALACGPLGEVGVDALARDDQRRQQPDALAAVVAQQPRGDRFDALRLDRHVAVGAVLRAELHVQQAQEVVDLGERRRPCSCGRRGWCAARSPPWAECRRSRRRRAAPPAARTGARRRSATRGSGAGLRRTGCRTPAWTCPSPTRR